MSRPKAPREVWVAIGDCGRNWLTVDPAVARCIGATVVRYILPPRPQRRGKPKRAGGKATFSAQRWSGAEYGSKPKPRKRGRKGAK